MATLWHVLSSWPPLRHKSCLTCLNRLRAKSTDSTAGHKSDGQLVGVGNFQEVNSDSFKELVTSDAMKDKIELIISEYEYEKYSTLKVPNTLTTDNMKDLLTVAEAADRKKMFNFLFIKQNSRIKSIDKRKEISRKYWTEKNEKYAKQESNRTGIWDNKQRLVYGLWHNTPLSKIMPKSLSLLHNNRLRRAALFGQKVVIDMSYDKCMKLHETRLLLKQLVILYNFNKYRSQEPFDLHFTGCDPNSTLMKEMPRFLPNFDSPRFMASLHQRSYLDLFPAQHLVYLSPHAHRSLEEVNEDMIFVIGGLIDKSFHQPITLTKAKSAGVQSYRLPIDEYILWRSGSKALCLNHVIAILHDVRMTGDWSQALRSNIPQRKQKSLEEVRLEDQLRKEKFRRDLKSSKSDKQFRQN